MNILRSLSIRRLAPLIHPIELNVLKLIVCRASGPLATVHSTSGSRGPPRAVYIDVARLAEVGGLQALRVVVKIVAREAQAADASPEGAVVAARAPGPACAGHDGQVVVAEAVYGRDGADEEAKEDVEAVVTKVEPARGGDEDGQAEGDEGDGEEVDGGRGGLAPQRLQARVVLGVAVQGPQLAGGIAAQARLLKRVAAGRGHGARREGAVHGVVERRGRGHDKRQGDGELARQEQRQVDEAGGGRGRVAAGVAAEAVVELLAVGLLADVARIEPAAGRLLAEAADDVLGGVGDVGLAPREQVGPRLAAHVLDAADEEEGGANGHEEPQPADMQLPHLAFPDEGVACVFGHGAAGDEDHGHEEDDDNGEQGAENNEEPGRHGFFLGKGEPVHWVLVFWSFLPLLACCLWCHATWRSEARGYGDTHEMLGSSRENGRLFGSMRPRKPATTVMTTSTIQSKAYEASSFTEKLPADEDPEWAILRYSDIRRHVGVVCGAETDESRARQRREWPNP